MKLISPPERMDRRPYPGLSVTESAALLRRYQRIERGCMRIAAAWILEAPAYEDKYALGYHLWDHAEHVQWIRERLEELRGGHPDASVEPGLGLAVHEALHARTTAELAAGLYLGVEAALLEAYRSHLRLADSAANASEVRLLQRMIPALESHVNWARSVLDRDGLDRSAAAAWQAYLEDLLARAEGVHGFEALPTGDPVGRPHSHILRRPSQIKFDQRIARRPLSRYEDREALPLQEQVKEQFEVFFNEFWAAGLLATVVYDACESESPWEFLYDMAHHCWDEIRHSEFGAIRLKELGTAPARVDTVFFDQAQSWPLLHRLCYVALDLEVYFMPRKRPRVLRYQNEGDGRSLVFADVDWSDEINHVGYGKKWIGYFLQNDARSVDDLKHEVMMLSAKEQGSDAAQGNKKVPF